MSLLSPQLEAFLSITKNKTVHSAAADLGLTQTGVTQRILTLEASLGTTLFLRSRRGMQLTREGEALLRYCQAAKDLEGATLASIQSGGATSLVRLTITGPTSFLRSRVLPPMLPVIKKYPELRLNLHITDRASWLDDLKSGIAQIAVVPEELIGRELASKKLRAEEYVLVGPRAWRARPLLEVVKTEQIIDFDPKDEMSFRYLKKFKLAEHAQKERHFVNNNESLAEMIEAKLGYGVFTKDFADRFLTRCQLSLLNDGKTLENRLALAWYPRSSAPEYWQATIKAIV